MKDQCCFDYGKFHVQTYGERSIIVRDAETRRLLVHDTDCPYRTESEIKAWLDSLKEGEKA